MLQVARFKVNLADPAGKVQTIELDGPKAQPLLGRHIGEVLDGSVLGFPGQKVKITGGSDKDGIPLSPSVHGSVKKYVLFSGAVGFHSRSEGERRRKLVRGRLISEETYQINALILRGEGAGARAEAMARPSPSQPLPEVSKKGKPTKAKSEVKAKEQKQKA